ncbi:MAG TPA: S9 family peptidase [Acidimicrobiales bacterium]|nr:S9 family peptidase [Acidimicrobiales bacterium]
MVELIPREVLFGNPERLSPALSPDATRLAWLAPSDGVLNVWVGPFGSESGLDVAGARVVTDDKDRGIRLFMWAPDGSRILYLQDTGGDENWRLYDVDLETNERRDLTPYDGVQARIVAAEPGRPDEILVGLNKDNPQLHDVYRLDLRNGDLERKVTNIGYLDWLADSELVVRGAVAPEPDGAFVLLVRSSPDDQWRALARFEAEDALSTDLPAFSFDGRSVLAVTSAGSDSVRLVAIDADNGAFSILAEQPGADVSHLRLHPVTKMPQVVTFLKERSEHQALDSSVAGDLEEVQRLHHGDLFFAGGDDADRHWLVGFTNDTGPVPYYVYDRKSGQAHFLFEHRPDLSRYRLAPMEPFSFTARDGLVLHGYGTFPLEAGRSALPTVLDVHGGPWARDVWGYNAEAQWLANRGYLCLQVNFRGSTGYGKGFINAGDREWGAKMHDDLLDAVAWAVDKGWSDPARVAIYGGSYGGYAALVGAAFSPEVFCCAIDVVGPSNLRTLIETIPPYWAPLIAQFHRRVGNPETEADFLWSRSPLSRVTDIRVPLLIAQGANDPRVKQSEAEQIVAALKEAGIDHEYMLFPDEGHGFAKPENRLQFYAAAERFLARYLGGRAEDGRAEE